MWPKTAIYTAATEMLGGGDAVKAQCRQPEIVADAAYVVLTSDSRSYSGNFDIDEDVLRRSGVTDLKKYSYFEDSKLLADFFIDSADVGGIQKFHPEPNTAAGHHGNPSSSTAGGPAADSELAKTFSAIRSMITEGVVKSIQAVYIFDLKDAGKYVVDLKNLPGSCGSISADTEADVTMTLDHDDFIKMFAGQMNPTSAFMTGRLKVTGDLSLAMKLEQLIKSLQAKL